MFEMKVELTLLDELLGTASADPELFRRFIESKRPAESAADDDEAESLPAVDEEVERCSTVFHRDDDGVPFLFDYQIKGFFKDACAMLRRAGEDGGESHKLKAFKKEIDGCIFVEPRKIRLNLAEGAEVGICQRPLRAQTAKGERVSLARSETVPAGTVLAFTVLLLKPDHEGIVGEWLAYGKYRGLGQWRNSGKGKFEYRIVGTAGTAK